jgi:hypothetical protein
MLDNLCMLMLILLIINTTNYMHTETFAHEGIIDVTAHVCFCIM